MINDIDVINALRMHEFAFKTEVGIFFKTSEFRCLGYLKAYNIMHHRVMDIMESYKDVCSELTKLRYELYIKTLEKKNGKDN